MYNNIYLILPSVDSGAGDGGIIVLPSVDSGAGGGGIKVVTLGPAESEANSLAQCHTVLQSMGNVL